MAEAEVTPASDLMVESLDHMNTMWLRSSAVTPLGAAALYALLGNTVSPARRYAWLVCISVAFVMTVASGVAYVVRRRRGPIHSWPMASISLVITGLAWSSVAWIALPPPSHDELRVVILLFCLAGSAMSIVSSAQSRARFYSYQVSLIVPLAIVFIASSDHMSRMLGLAIPLYLVGMAAVHEEVHRVVTSEMRLKHELSLANARLTDLAMHDGLTGLTNRTAFAEALDTAVAQAARTDELIGLIYFDLDRFKSVNDAFGHEVGDAVLIEAANRIRASMRSGDTCARLGGDEFGMLLRGLSCAEDVHLVAERVRVRFEAPFTLAGQEMSIAASIGVATAAGGVDAPALLRASDTAQYRAKQSGGNRVVSFDDAMRRWLEGRIAAEGELRTALTRREIVPFYQPEVELTSGRIVAAEVLARWLHPTRGTLAAATFIETAHAAGLLSSLDESVMRQALAARVDMRSHGVPDDFRLWLNIAPYWLTGGDGRTRLQRLLRETQCRPDELGIEITEGEVLQDLDAAAQLLGQAREAGIKVALDDFGTGHSSLTLLRRLPIDVVKIDRSFVSEMATDSRDRAVVECIVDLAAKLDIRVLAEGVETPEHRCMLAELGCDLAQGYLYSPAVPLEELEAAVGSQSLDPAGMQH